MATSSPQRRQKNQNPPPPAPPAVFLPSFSPPDPQPLAPPLPSNQPESPGEPELEPTAHDGDLSPRQNDRIPLSTTGSKSFERADLPKIVAGLLKIGIALAEAAIVRTTPRRLRRPTEQQLADIANPSASLLKRYTNLANAPESLIDIADLATGISDYVLDEEPLMPFKQVDVRHVGMPETDDAPNISTPSDTPPDVHFLQ